MNWEFKIYLFIQSCSLDEVKRLRLLGVGCSPNIFFKYFDANCPGKTSVICDTVIKFFANILITYMRLKELNIYLNFNWDI